MAQLAERDAVGNGHKTRNNLKNVAGGGAVNQGNPTVFPPCAMLRIVATDAMRDVEIDVFGWFHPGNPINPRKTIIEANVAFA
nr:MAG TPA: hypothetical protein [Caudoviricetes sp.]